jgi:hypothetical protein
MFVLFLSEVPRLGLGISAGGSDAAKTDAPQIAQIEDVFAMCTRALSLAGFFLLVFFDRQRVQVSLGEPCARGQTRP